MLNLLELTSVSRYRLFLGLASVLLIAAQLVRFLTVDDGHSATRIATAVSTGLFALLAARVPVISRYPHAFAVLCLLPLTLHMAAMTYVSHLSYGMAIANLVILVIACGVVNNKFWLNVQVGVWCTCVLNVAWAVENPIMSPLIYTLLMVVLAVFSGMLIISFYEAQAGLARKIAELDESQEFARVGTWELDLRSGQATWSNTTKKIMRVDADSEPMSFGQMMLDNPTNREFIQQITQYFEGDDSFDAIGQVITGTGDPIWVHSRGTTFYEERKPVRKFGVFLDISKQVEREQALEDARLNAESAVEARTQFLANMSHELRTPMNGVIGMTTLLQEETLSAEAAEQVKVIQSCSDTLLATINDILDFTKMDAGKIELEARPFDLCEVVATSIQIVRHTIERKGLELQVSLDSKRLYLSGDALRLQQVLVNLLSNASKFTERGSVQVTARTLEVTDGQCRFEIEVADTGVGISDQAQQRLFSPFVQADASTTRKFGGTGLGLAICHEVVTQMQGKISLHSVLGEGSAFTLEMTLPMSDAPVAKRKITAKSPVPDNLKILLAEDNQVNQVVATRMLGKLGLDAVVVGDGQRAFEMAVDGDFDLIFMDLQMPVMDGIEATKRIRSHRGIRQPRIIALTANALDEDRNRCLQAGMDDFLSKPMRLNALRDAVAADKVAVA